MATKIKIKFSRPEYEAMRVFITHASAWLNVDGLISLLAKETLEDLKLRFDAKQYREQKSYQFSLSVMDAYVLMNHVAWMGDYERAVCELIFEQQIHKQLQRAVQMRMNFNNN